jgi:hypothetical protein
MSIGSFCLYLNWISKFRYNIFSLDGGRKSWCLGVDLGLADFWLSVVPEFEALQIGNLHFWLVGVWWDG